PGTLDPDYRGEVHVILANFGEAPFPVARGARIAQLVLSATVQASICEVANLDETTRGVRGFGSTCTGRAERSDSFRHPFLHVSASSRSCHPNTHYPFPPS